MTAFWGMLGLAVVALLGLAGTVYTARSARRATDRSALIEERAEFTKSYSQLASDLRADREHDRQQITRLRDTVTEVQEQMGRMERRYVVAIGYIRQLRTKVTQIMPLENIPPVPPELEQDIT